MDALEFISAFRWPIVVSGALYFFHGTIKTLFANSFITKAELAGLKLELKERENLQIVKQMGSFLDFNPAKVVNYTYSGQINMSNAASQETNAANDIPEPPKEPSAEISWSPSEAPQDVVIRTGQLLRSALMHGMPFDTSKITAYQSGYISNAWELGFRGDELKAIKSAIDFYYEVAHAQAQGISWDVAHQYVAVGARLLERIAEMKALYPEDRRENAGDAR